MEADALIERLALEHSFWVLSLGLLSCHVVMKEEALREILLVLVSGLYSGSRRLGYRR